MQSGGFLRVSGRGWRVSGVGFKSAEEEAAAEALGPCLPFAGSRCRIHLEEGKGFRV